MFSNKTSHCWIGRIKLDTQKSPVDQLSRTIIGSTDISTNSTSSSLAKFCSEARRVDIATGYFEFSAFQALLAETHSIKNVAKFQILIGNESSSRSRNQTVEFQTIAKEISQSTQEETNPTRQFILTLLRNKRLEIKIIKGGPLFHPKLYIFHPNDNSELTKSAVIGSSNFTKGGLSRNVELNLATDSRNEVNQLQNWFDDAWKNSFDVTEVVEEFFPPSGLEERKPSPNEVFVKAMYEFFGNEQTPLSSDWFEKNKQVALGQPNKYSQIYPTLDEYQREAFQDLIGKAEEWNGAFLCDGVGLGKTRTGLMLIEYYTKMGKKVLVISPKSVEDLVWSPKRIELLGHVANGLIDLVHTSNLIAKYDENPKSFEEYDVILIDEAHHFRNSNSKRYGVLQKIFTDGNKKDIFYLTATPINNSVTDLKSLIEIFSTGNNEYFSSLGDEARYISLVFKTFQEKISARKKIGGNKLIKALIVQRSRNYVRKSMKISKEQQIFPIPSKPNIIQFKPNTAYIDLIKIVGMALSLEGSDLNTLKFPIYNNAHYFIGDEEEKKQILGEDYQMGRPDGLIKIGFLKRLESSIPCFANSIETMLKKNIAFLHAVSSSTGEKGTLKKWQKNHSLVLEILRPNESVQQENEDDNDSIDEEFGISSSIIEHKKYFDLETVTADTYQDMEKMVNILKGLEKIKPEADAKLQKLFALLKNEEHSLKDNKLVIFTQFITTADYLERELQKQFPDRIVKSVHSKTIEGRSSIIKRFAPYYNGSSLELLACNCQGGLKDESGNSIHSKSCMTEKEINILISTDVLAEGLNLQDSNYLINFDIHWNPVKLMQRIGRVDRRLNPAIEDLLKKAYPGNAAMRGKIKYWNFLPPESLENLIKLQKRVESKYSIISAILGLEGGRGLTNQQQLSTLHELYTSSSNQLGGLVSFDDGLDEIRLDFQKILLNEMRSLQSDDLVSSKEGSGKLAFFCYSVPIKIESDEVKKWGPKWLLYNFEKENGGILDDENDLLEIYQIIKSEKTESYYEGGIITPAEVKKATKEVKKYLKQEVGKQLQWLAGMTPKLKCLMLISKNTE
jgi:hypothetical protein